MEFSRTRVILNTENDDDCIILKRLQDFGPDAEIARTAWSSAINIHDPDGNRMGIHDEATFVAQIGVDARDGDLI